MGLRERPVLYKMRVGIVSLQRVPTLYGVIRQIVLVFVVCWLVFVGLVGGWANIVGFSPCSVLCFRGF